MPAGACLAGCTIFPEVIRMKAIRTTYHTHNIFCDGRMTPEDYVKSAIRKGFAAIGISSHAPVCFETEWTMKPEKLQEYLKTVAELKQKYQGKIQVYTGLETDYYLQGEDYRSYTGLDYTIGSVHFMHHSATGRYLALDGTPAEFAQTRDLVFNGDTQALIEKYYHLMTEMVINQPPSIVGHLDILKKNNGGGCFFDESKTWYHQAVERCLDVIAQRQVVVEVNTGGIARGYTTEMYPSDWILRLMREREIPVVLNSDAHHPDSIDAFYPEAVEKLKAAGYTHQRVLLDNLWQDVQL